MHEQAKDAFWRGKTRPLETGETPFLPICPVDNRDQTGYIGSSVVEPATTSDLDDAARCNVPRHSFTSSMVQL